MYGILGTVHCLLFQDYMKVNKDDKGRWKITKCFRRYVPVLFTCLSLFKVGELTCHSAFWLLHLNFSNLISWERTVILHY